MINLKKLTMRRRTTATSLLGLALDGSRLEGVWLKRANGALQVQAAFAVTLTLDPLTAAPELVGREIRNHLDAAEIRERACVVALPLKWALVAQVKLPPLAEADVAGFLQLEAERSFPSDLATLITATSRSKPATGEPQAMLIGMPRPQITTLETALRAAGLKPESFSLGITALQPAEETGVLALRIGETHVGLQITHGGGVVVLRSLEGAIENVSGHPALQMDLIARETRITLGQLPEAVRNSVQLVRIFGPHDLAAQLATELNQRLAALQLSVTIVSQYGANEFKLPAPADAPVSAAFSLAAEKLTDRGSPFEFLPPKISQWQQFSSRYATGKLRKAGVIAATIVALVVAAFMVQQFFLWRLQTRWDEMKSRVQELEVTQAQIKQYRPWYDESARTLSILRQLTQAFPEDGVVTAKTVEISDVNLVTCTGTARDMNSLLQMQEKLGKSGNVAALKLIRSQGKSPMQFTFDFRWMEGGAHAN